MNNTSSTICAPATSTGGAIGVIRVSGSLAVEYVNVVFSKDISSAPGYSMHYGTIIDSNVEEAKDTIVDEVIVSVCRAPRSYTGEDTVEISHHGSSYIQQRILELLLQQGCMMAQPGEFTQRAYLNGKLDLSQAEAVADLISSSNATNHRIALQQMRGGYSAKLRELRSQLLHMTSLLELELDFSEEDVEFADRSQLLTLAENIKNEIDKLASSFHQGNALKNGIPVAIIGAPNVGKSTLLNALLHDDKAIVSDIQGTTRDLVEDTMVINGVTFRFIDTAGIRHTEDSIEQMGIERSIKASTQALIIILLTEPDVPYPSIEVSNEQTLIHVVNKSDLLDSFDLNNSDDRDCFYISAKDGIGILELENRLCACVAKPSEETILVTNTRHYEAMLRASSAITNSIHSMQLGFSGDLIAEDLRLCISHLADITGEQITTDQVLHNIFKNFCIGK